MTLRGVLEAKLQTGADERKCRRVHRRASAFSFFLAGAVLLGLPGCPGPSLKPQEAQFARLGETRIASVAGDCREVSDFVFSFNGRRVIYTGFLSDDHAPRVGVWLNDSLMARVDSVFELGFTEANEPYFVGQDAGKAFVYYHYSRPHAYERIVSASFTPDGRCFAYLAANGGRRSLTVTDGATQTRDNVLDYALCPVGERFAFATRDSADWFVVENNDTSDIYDWVQGMTYSRDGSTLAYAALADDQWIPVRNGKELEGCGGEAIEISDVTLSPDGTHIAYHVTELDTGIDETYDYTVADDQEGEAYLGVSGLVFGPKGTRFGYVADDGDGQFIVADGIEEPAHEHVWGLAFSPDELKMAFVAQDSEDEFVVVNGREFSAYDQVDKVLFSKDSRRLGYGAMDGRDFLWVVEDTRAPGR